MRDLPVAISETDIIQNDHRLPRIDRPHHQRVEAVDTSAVLDELHLKIWSPNRTLNNPDTVTVIRKPRREHHLSTFRGDDIALVQRLFPFIKITDRRIDRPRRVRERHVEIRSIHKTRRRLPVTARTFWQDRRVMIVPGV